MTPAPLPGSDDLDAFFDDVDKVVEEAVEPDVVTEKNTFENENRQPPSKKQRTDDAPHQPPPPRPVRPRGVVVAAASSSSSKKKDVLEESTATHDRSQIGLDHSRSPVQGFASNTTETMVGPHPLKSSVEVSKKEAATIQESEAKQRQQHLHSHVRTAGGKTWVDTSLDDWPDDDFRIFVGNLGNDVSDTMLYQHFTKYASLQRAKIVRDSKKQGNKNQQQQFQQQQFNNNNNNNKSDSKGYGFVSFGNALDCAKAIREMDQSWLGSRPIRIKRSTWKDREVKQVRKKEKQKIRHEKKLGLL